MEVQGLPIVTGPADHLRQGFLSFEQAHKAPHPVQVLQTQADYAWNLKLDTVRRTYGSHLAMRLATEKQILSRSRRLPGLESSNIALATVLGEDESIDYKDFLNGTNFPPVSILFLLIRLFIVPSMRPNIPKIEVHSQMEIQLGLM
jgi:proteasome maturation protein